MLKSLIRRRLGLGETGRPDMDLGKTSEVRISALSRASWDVNAFFLSSSVATESASYH